MDLETLERAKKIETRMNELKYSIERCNYTQSEKAELRQMGLDFNGINGGIIVPKSLFRVVGKLVLSELQNELNDLEKELHSL